MAKDLVILNQEIVGCTACPRLVEYREKIGREKRRAYLDWEYWAKPVPGFGDAKAKILVLGLAPGAHGSNRTGRMFTGDGSGYFMYPVLHKAGLASQPNSTRRDDGMKLHGLYITAVARCAPPANKPLPEELANCSGYLDRELAILKDVQVVVALGRVACIAYIGHLKRHGMNVTAMSVPFGHGATHCLPDGRILLCSYHPSMQNTNTGRLTEKMFLEIFKKAAKLVR